jgi:hypothetical protein
MSRISLIKIIDIAEGIEQEKNKKERRRRERKEEERIRKNKY